MNLIPTAYAAYDLSQDYGFGDIKSVPDLIGRLMGPAFAVAAIIVTFYFMFATIKLMTSAGDKAKVGEAREMITHAIIGLIMLLVMWLVLRFIPEFFGLKINIFGT